jgi:CubicO group peptidase (beta-lactamase class C family)
MLKRRYQLILILAVMSFLSGCHAGRFLFWNTADTKDQFRFPAYTVENAGPVYNFKESNREIPPVLTESIKKEHKYDEFDEFLEAKHTLAFIVIKNDTILYERYLNGVKKESQLTGFSIAKAFVSALTGMAIEEGYIKSLDDPVTNYLDGFKNKGFDKVTIRNLLNMRSGIKFSETYYNPFGHAAKFYYGRNLEKYVYKLKVTRQPGTEYYYNSANTLILAMIIEKTTGKKFTEYFSEKIWQPLGMEEKATWSYDSEKHGMVKAFCCLNGVARDFAKFGQLYLNHGMWNGKQLLAPEWIEHSMGIHNDSKDLEGYPYTFFWRVLDNGCMFAKGILGQYIFLDPSKDLIIVRFGNKRGNVHWSALIDEIAGQY